MNSLLTAGDLNMQTQRGLRPNFSLICIITRCAESHSLIQSISFPFLLSDTFLHAQFTQSWHVQASWRPNWSRRFHFCAQKGPTKGDWDHQVGRGFGADDHWQRRKASFVSSSLLRLQFFDFFTSGRLCIHQEDQGRKHYWQNSSHPSEFAS